MSAVQKTISPVDNSVYVERPYATPADIAATLKRAAAVHRRKFADRFPQLRGMAMEYT